MTVRKSIRQKILTLITHCSSVWDGGKSRCLRQRARPHYVSQRRATCRNLELLKPWGCHKQMRPGCMFTYVYYIVGEKETSKVFIHSFIHSLTHSLIHSFTHSLIHSFTPSLIHSLTHLLFNRLFRALQGPRPLPCSPLGALIPRFEYSAP